MAESTPAGETLSTAKLHALATALDLAGLALVSLEALFWVPAEAADRRVLLLTIAVVPIALIVFALMPRRSGFLPERAVARRSLMVYASLGVPLLVTLLTLLLVGMSRSFDSFAGFALLLAADGGRNLWESLRLQLGKRR
ncbi:MAG TPA: hypothetical protein VFV77_01905 [Gammaproteobacteria bacterium]|nr:hypothetical protein [Gammaproteobacteria bacterium]